MNETNYQQIPSQYNQPMASGNYQYNDPRYNPMSVGDWILTNLVLAIPIVNIIMYFVWAFSSGTNINKRNFCRASLIIGGVFLVIYLIVVVAVMGSAIGSNY